MRLNGWKLREVDRRFALVQALIGSVPVAARALRPEACQMFLFGGSGGLDERAFVDFRTHLGKVLACELVPLGSWRDWVVEGSDFNKLVKRVRCYIETRSFGRPIRLAGYSQGGQIAYATATALALEQDGNRVESWGLIDMGEEASGERAFPKLGFSKGILRPLKDWIAATLLAKRIAELPDGDPRISILIAAKDWPRGSDIITLIGRLAPLLLTGRASLRFDRILQRGLFHDMWFAWTQKNRNFTPLRAPTFLFRTWRPGSRLGQSKCASNHYPNSG